MRQAGEEKRDSRNITDDTSPPYNLHHCPGKGEVRGGEGRVEGGIQERDRIGEDRMVQPLRNRMPES